MLDPAIQDDLSEGLIQGMPTFMVVHFLSLRLLVSTYVGASCHKYCTGFHEEMLTLTLVNSYISRCSVYV